jgi:hypothetical protein
MYSTAQLYGKAVYQTRSMASIKFTSGKGLQNPQRGFESHRRLCIAQEALES